MWHPPSTQREQGYRVLALAQVEPKDIEAAAAADDETPRPCCGGRMRVVEVLERGSTPRSVNPVVRFDTS
jgi:hypothetical protein